MSHNTLQACQIARHANNADDAWTRRQLCSLPLVLTPLKAEAEEARESWLFGLYTGLYYPEQKGLYGLIWLHIGIYGFIWVLYGLNIFGFIQFMLRHYKDAYQPTSKMECNFVFMTE